VTTGPLTAQIFSYLSDQKLKPPWVLEKFIRKERVALNYMSIEEMMITEIQPINFEWINLLWFQN